MSLKTLSCVSTFILLIFLGLYSYSAIAADSDLKIAILDFELKDLTPTPNGAEELARTASLGPLLRTELNHLDKVSTVNIDAEAQSDADKGAGYLFDRPELAAELGATVGADYVAVGRLHKPSFLFAYLKVLLVDVKKKTLIGDYTVEIKGSVKKITQRGITRLASKIYRTLTGIKIDS